MKDNKGITLIALVAYMLLIIIIIAILTSLTAHFRNNLAFMRTDTATDVEFDKVALNMLKEVKNDNSFIRLLSTKEVLFRYSDGSPYHRYLYVPDKQYLLLYDHWTGGPDVNMSSIKKVAEDIEDCRFVLRETNYKQVLHVIVKINGQTRVYEFVKSMPF